MKFFRKCLRNKKGFTLIEIVVAVALIGILLSIVMPSFDKAGERTRNSKLTADLKALDTAIGLYKLDNGALPEDLSKLKPDYITGKDEFKDAQNNNLSYSLVNEKGTYKLSGKNSKGEEVFSVASNKE